MSENDMAFYRKLKNLNWTFVIIQAIIFIFVMGVTYNRLLTVEKNYSLQEAKVSVIEQKLAEKADKKAVDDARTERKAEIRELKEDLRSDLREIRTMLENHIQNK